jgi:hypothetical protein
LEVEFNLEVEFKVEAKVQRVVFCGECCWFLVFLFFEVQDYFADPLRTLRLKKSARFCEVSAVSAGNNNPRKSETIRVIRVPFFSASA